MTRLAVASCLFLPLVAAGLLASSGSAWGLGLVPVNVGPPGISGAAVRGQTLTCSTGTWLNAPTSYAYSWQRDAATIAGQETSQYALTSADVAQAITCSVLASNAAGASVAPSPSCALAARRDRCTLV